MLIPLMNGIPMQITVNGKPRKVPDDTTAATLIDTLGLSGRRLAMEVNGEIVPKSRHAVHGLAPGDRIEIVHAVGGG
jgi:sulfur carrier protein